MNYIQQRKARIADRRRARDANENHDPHSGQFTSHGTRGRERERMLRHQESKKKEAAEWKNLGKLDRLVSKGKDLVTDPPVSEAQRRAMFAAKAGHSNLGIPQKVGREFSEADPGGSLPEKKGDAVPLSFLDFDANERHDPATGQFSSGSGGSRSKNKEFDPGEKRWARNLHGKWNSEKISTRELGRQYRARGLTKSSFGRLLRGE